MKTEVEVIKKGSPLPDSFLQVVQDNDNGGDFAFAITDTPIFLVLVLQGVSQREIESVESGSFEIGTTTVNKIPFITLNYRNGFVFDFVVETMKELKDPNKNAINIILVEKNGYIVKAMRAIGAEPKLIQTIQSGVKELNGHNVDRNTLAEVYSDYSSQLLHMISSTQKFPSH